MLVDDPVVAADGINRELAAGRPCGTAAWLGPYRLRRAILFGTIINIAAFLPLALLPGDMGAFIIALPLVIQFNSVMKSLVVMLTVPLGLAGAFAGLALTRAAFGFMALLGIVSLAGVIVSHIIVLSDFIEEARAAGMELKQALVQAGLVRLRAVLATVLATVCGLIPLALQGGELWRPLTAVHIFGLLLATLLTLLVLPVWYYLFAARLRWIE